MSSTDTIRKEIDGTRVRWYRGEELVAHYSRHTLTLYRGSNNAPLNTLPLPEADAENIVSAMAFGDPEQVELTTARLAEGLIETGGCEDCGRSTFYDYKREDYRHATEPERGCFLIAADPVAEVAKRDRLAWQVAAMETAAMFENRIYYRAPHYWVDADFQQVTSTAVSDPLDRALHAYLTSSDAPAGSAAILRVAVER